MKKSLEITEEQAKELLTKMPDLTEVIYFNFPQLKPKPKVLDKWEDLGNIEGYFIELGGDIDSYSGTTVRSNKNVFATEKQAESSLAFAQLTQLMKATGDEVSSEEWDNRNIAKYTILRSGKHLQKDTFYCHFHPISFKTVSIRNEFFDKHQELLKTYLIL